MKKKFIVGAILSIFLITLNQLLIQYALHQKKQDSKIINMSGRQRMLSQRVALKFHEFSEDKADISDIQKYFTEWQESHDKLLTACTKMSTSPFAKAKQNEITDELKKLSPLINFIGDQLAEYKTTKSFNIESIIKNQEAFLVKMDNIVSEYTEYSDDKLVIIIILEIILAAFSILVILLEVRYIYYPQAKVLKESFEKIEQKEKDLEETNHLLDIKNRELEEFNYIVSHDLKEPLRTISNYTQIIEEDFSDQTNGEIKNHIKKISNASRRMESLIMGLLNYSRLGKNKELTLCNCNQIVEDVISDLDNLLKTTSASVQIMELPSIYAYEIEMRQLFQNLIGNAIKFRKNDVVPKIKIGVNAINGFYEFFISDNGIGIDPKHFDKIFHVFQRLHNSKEYEGHGIGLANCKKIVEMHGGKIWVESEYNAGSTFKFSILNIQP